MRNPILWLIVSLLLTVRAQAQGEEPAIDQFIYADTEPAPLNMAEVRAAIGYPESAIERNVQGNVVVRILVDEAGAYVRHQVIKSDHPLLTQAVEPHVASLKFSPGLNAGTPLKFWVNIPFAFKLVTAEEQAARNRVKRITDSLETHADDYTLWHLRGVARNDAGMYDLAIQDFEESLKRNPRKNKKKDSKPYAYLFYAHFGRAIAYSGKEDYKQGISDCTAALTFATEMKGTDTAVVNTLPEVYLERGYLHLLDSAYDQALADLNLVVSGGSDRVCTAWALLAEMAVSSKNNDELIRCYTGLAACKPDDDLVRYSLGYYRSEAGQYTEALQDLAIVTEHTQNPALRLAAINRAGWCHLQQQNYTDALAAFDRALSYNVLNPAAYYYRALVYKAQQKQDDACKSMRQALVYGLEGEDYDAAVAYMRTVCGGWEE
ncbi:MAG: TonB family protein [Bacteroidia bacterium]|nr:TonB family protein [Bacteroidia bacterium]